jgi:predicted ribosome quality control (RQC) complex YloA/Tae2 family protein
MKILLYMDKSLEENAGIFYDKAKKLKLKIEGAENAIELAKKKLKKKQLKTPIEKTIKARKKEWFEKFHWFFSSTGFLCIGGRDATTNDILIKKHLEEGDIVFHASIAGSPFFVVKSKGKDIDPLTLEETAQATAIYSRAWRLGYPSLEVFWVKHDQVSLTPRSGEFMPKGSFMIYGKTNKIKAELKSSIGIKKNQIIGGPASSTKFHSEKYLVLVQGDVKPSDMAKKIKKKLKFHDLDEIIRFIPGNSRQI